MKSTMTRLFEEKVTLKQVASLSEASFAKRMRFTSRPTRPTPIARKPQERKKVDVGEVRCSKKV